MTQARDVADGKFTNTTLTIDSGSDNANTLLLSDGAADANIVDGFVTSRHHSSSEEPVLMIQGRSTSSENIVLIGGTHNNSTYNTATSIKFFTASGYTNTTPVERMRVLSGGGLTFNGDTAAANALDDYEEGTFTPTVTVGTISVADAAYTKVGRKVTVHFNAYSFSDRSSSSHIEFTNMPFTSDSSIGSTANSGMHRYVNAGDSLAFYMPRNQSKIQLFSLNSGSGWTPTQYSHLNSTAAEMYVHLTYFTAS